MQKLFILFLFSALTTACKEPKVFDLSVSAQEGGDVTVVLSGCNEGYHEGYLFCRVAEGINANQVITINIPSVNCDHANCAVYQFAMPNGNLGIAGGFPKGTKEKKILLSEIIDSDVISKEHNNEYPFDLDIRFKDGDGYEHVFTTRGLVRVWIVKDEYRSLACKDPETGWNTEISKKCEAEYSTAGRTALCGDCKKQVFKP